MGLFGKKKDLVEKHEEQTMTSKSLDTVKEADATANTPAKKTATQKREGKTTLRKAVAKPSPVKTAKKAGRQAYRVLRRPLITEKSAVLASEGVYVFEVYSSCGKVEVKHAIKELYGVMPRRVNMLAMDGKHVRFGRRSGVRRDYKKAFVYLKSGETIDVFDAK